MKYYLVSLSTQNSEEIPDQFKALAQSEPCTYRQSIPTSKISNPGPEWPADVAEKLKIGFDVETSVSTSFLGDEVEWTSFSYPGIRYFIEEKNLDLSKLVELAGGELNIHARNMPNSTNVYQNESEVFLGSPEIEGNIIEIVDDGLEQALTCLGNLNK